MDTRERADAADQDIIEGTDVSYEAMLKKLEKLTLEQQGEFYDYLVESIREKRASRSSLE